MTLEGTSSLEVHVQYLMYHRKQHNQLPIIEKEGEGEGGGGGR